jgi:hypothetical protein
MSPEWLTAIGTMGTFVVISASAVAALLQLRHMRATNQLAAITELFEVFESPAFQDARRFVNRELPQLLEDPENRKLALVRPIPKQFEQARMIFGFFENVGTLVKRGIIDADLLCDLWSPIIIGSWQRLSSWALSSRTAHRNEGLYENFEYLAVRAQQFMDAHPSGSYPKSMPRSRSGSVWPEARVPNES